MPIDSEAAITISGFAWVPEFARGYVRDLRARWALEEAGLAYRTKLLHAGEQDEPAYRALQPFGQVPMFEENGLVLFETGSILLHIGQRSSVLLPEDPAARARAVTWVIAALSSIEPHAMNVVAIDFFHKDEEWAKLRRPSAVEFVQRRLSGLAKALDDKPYLEGDQFTAGDLMMAAVLRVLDYTDYVTAHPNLAAFQARCEARPAYQRALTSHMADFENL